MSNKKKPTIIIHIGWPKTATTYLQNEVFTKSNKINYIGKEFTNKHWWNIEKSILLDDKQSFNNKKQQYIDFIHKQLDHELVNLISHEGFTRTTRYNPTSPIDPLRTIDRLLSIFSENSNVKFMLFTRNHVDMLHSYYNQFDIEFYHYKISLEDVFSAIKEKDTGSMFCTAILDSLKYGRTINHIEKEIGQENVSAIPYEGFRENKNILNNELSRLSEQEISLHLPNKTKNNTKTKLFRHKIRKRLSFLSRRPKPACIGKHAFEEHEKNIKKYYSDDLSKIENHTIKGQLKRHNYL